MHSKVYKRIARQIRFDVMYEWYMQFDDPAKIKCLNKMIDNKGRELLISTTKDYVEYIMKYYYDETFNNIYTMWAETKCNYLKPSIDHIIPVSLGNWK